jgi:3-phosphoshikimate 1-carboxyvinyltransferase
MVMAAAVLAGLCDGPVTVRGCEAVNKSYPDFFLDYKVLGGAVHVL